MTRSALVVDPDDDTRRILGVLLPRAGLDALATDDAENALDMVRARTPAVVIAELYLPTAAARCFVRALKQDPALSAVPVLVYTAHCTAADMQWAADSGCDGFVAKPARWTELEPAITRLIAHRPPGSRSPAP